MSITIKLIVSDRVWSSCTFVYLLLLTGPAGPKPWELVPRITCPMLVAWGDTDPFTPLDGPVGQFFLKQAIDRPNTEVGSPGLPDHTVRHGVQLCQ